MPVPTQAKVLRRSNCWMCNRPIWQHERDKFGNIVRKVEFRDASSPPICVPNKGIARKLDAAWVGKEAAFGRQVA